MKNSKYWEERFLELKKEMLSVTEKDWEKISNIYAKTIKGIEKEIAYWYQRYSKDNKIDYLTAVQKITSKEFKDFKVSLDDYIAMGEASNYTNIYNDILEKASSKYHITRLELLKFNLLIYSDNLHAEFEKELGNGLKKLFSEQYYRTAYAIQRGLNSAKVLSDVNTYALDVLKTPWFGDGEQFSSRIWQARDKLAVNLERELTHAFIRGDNPNRLTDRVAFLFKTNQNNSARLLQTEYAAISSTAQEKVYQDLDVEEFIFIATLDMRTSKICQDMDGHHFSMKDYKVGINAPPLHPRCRSCTAPYFPDMTVPRWARGEDGKSYVIDENITYKEWRKKYVNDNASKTSVDTLPFTDITNQWTLVDKDKRRKVKDLNKWSHNGKIYPVAGKYVVLDYDAHEKEVAELLADYGKVVFMAPKIKIPENIRTPDYLVDGESWDLKTLKKKAGQNTIYNRIYKAKHQATSFVIDLTKTNLTDKIVEEQMKKLFRSDTTKFVNTVVIIIDMKIKQVFKRA